MQVTDVTKIWGGKRGELVKLIETFTECAAREELRAVGIGMKVRHWRLKENTAGRRILEFYH